MRCGEEGKLLASAAGFYHPGGAKQVTELTSFCVQHLLQLQKMRFAFCRRSRNPFRSHQGEREKNEYS
jgi:hypothetical protein